MQPASRLSTTAWPLLLSFIVLLVPSQKKPWPVPDAAKSKKNPVATSSASVAAGKTLWDTHCKSCHGAKGLGDGPKASQLNTEPGDFSKNDFQSQTDGSLFYKTSEGRDDMPSYKKKIPAADDIWNLVNYMRTFKKGGAVIAPVKDTVKKTDKPPVVNNQPPKKDTTGKKEVINFTKPETLPLQEQVNRLAVRVDSLEKELKSLKTRIDSTQKK